MGEVTEMFDVTPSLIRYWESSFDRLKPSRNKKGNRLFSPEDVETLKLIYHLVKERGMTIEGARKALVKGTVIKGSSLERDAKLMERLQHLRSMLLDLKLAIKDGDGGVASPRSRHDSDREPDAEPRELFAFYEQRLF